MLISTRKMAVKVITTLGFMLFSINVLAAVTNCHPTSGAGQIELDINFNITSNTSSMALGTPLATSDTPFYGMTCTFTGTNSALNGVYLKNTMPSNIKELLLNSGVEVTQESGINDGPTVTITNSTVPNIYLGYWLKPDVGVTTNIGLLYSLSVKKGINNLKPFDTGLFLLGTHVSDQGQNLGAPIYMRIVGNLTLLCPAPAVNITASHGGRVNFDTISPQKMNAGDAISRSFDLNMTVPQNCETGLNVSVRFEPNSNAVLNDKYLDMGNGLQTLLSSHATDIYYNQNYDVGEVLPLSPVNIPYVATLTKIPGSTITSGSFSKTIRVVVSY